MAAARSVLVLTDRCAPTADCVVEELNRRNVPVFRIDTSEFPIALSVDAELTERGWCGRAQTTRRTLAFPHIAGAYYRRPTSFRFHPEMSTGERRWSNTQARLGFDGLLTMLKPWLNHPHHIGYAEYKPVQLDAAIRCSLRVPRRPLTNNPDSARAFVADVGTTVYKPFGSTVPIPRVRR